MRHSVVAALFWCTVSGVDGPARAQAPATPRDTTWVARAALYEVFVRDFSASGDLRGVERGLARIQATGATVVWLMPIYPVGVRNRKGTLGSPYSVRDYRGIDPAYGTPRDLSALVKAAHARGLKVILDWVPNHTAWDNPWITAHPDWYVHDSTGAISLPRDEQGKLTDWNDVAQLNYTNPALRREMIATLQYWLDTYDLDGFRVDVAGFVPDAFWREAIPALRRGTPRRLLLLAEWGDLRMHTDGFDLSYGWNTYAALKDVWKGGRAAEFVPREVAELRGMPAGGMRLRFTTNHDETAWDNPPITLFGKGDARGARAAFVAMALLPGRPLLYNGQEVESPQKLGLFERAAVRWVQRDAPIAQAFYAKVLRLATTDSAFVHGTFSDVGTSASADVIAYRRGDALVLVNTRPRRVKLEVTGFTLNGARDLLSGRVLSAPGGTITLPPWGAQVLAMRQKHTRR